MSILVAAPTSDKKDYCISLYARQVQSFTYHNYDNYLIDTSEDKQHVQRLWKLGLNAERLEPYGNPTEYITRSQNLIREKVLMDGYEWLFLLETDVFVPLNILEYLMSFENPVHAFSYFITDDKAKGLCLQGLTESDDKRGMRLNPTTGDSLFNGEIKENSGVGYDVYATGMGCVLIHRDVLEEIDFRIDPKHPNTFSDSYFFEDVKSLGIRAVLDTTIVPAHYMNDSYVTDLKVFQ